MFNMMPFTKNVIRHVFILRERIMGILHKILIVVIFGQYINDYCFIFLM